MGAHIELSEPPVVVDAGAADAVGAARPVRIRYRATNGGNEASTGHWDHVAIVDRTGTVQYEDWHREGPMEPGAGYEAVFDVAIALDGGSYLVWVTLDGGGRTPTRRAEPLSIGRSRPRPASGHRIEIDEPPAPLERVRMGAAFRVFYTATNAGTAASAGHYDRLVVAGGHDAWEGWHAVGGLAPGDRYDAVVDVPGLAAGDYRLEWTLDWAVNHPLAEPDPASTGRVSGDTFFAVDPHHVPATRPA